MNDASGDPTPAPEPPHRLPVESTGHEADRDDGPMKRADRANGEPDAIDGEPDSTD